MLDPEGDSGRGFDDIAAIDVSSFTPRRRETRAAWIEREIMPHEPSLRRVLARKYPGLDADDIIQATYLRLMTTNEVEHVKDCKYYFFRTANSQVVDNARRQSLREYESLDAMGMEWADDAPDFERAFDAKRAVERCIKALEELSPRRRTVVHLRRFEGLRPQAIADRLAISISAVEKHQTNAMRTLQKAVFGS